MKLSLSILHAITTALRLLVLTAACQVPNALAQSIDEPWNWTEEFVRSGVNQVRAGRDLNPDSWPGGARVAVLLSFNVDNETIQGLRNGQFSIGPLSQGQYGARVALPRIVKLMDEENIPSTFFFPAWSLKLAPEQADVINNSGLHEIGVHGWIHELNTALDAATEERLLRQAVDEIMQITGQSPVGYRAPSWNHSPNTLQIVRDMGFLYESSLMHDDRPYELLQDGEATGMVELPVEWILDDEPARCHAGVDRRVRQSLGGGHHVSAHHAPSRERAPFAHRRFGRPHRSHQSQGGSLVRHPRGSGALRSRAGGIVIGIDLFFSGISQGQILFPSGISQG